MIYDMRGGGVSTGAAEPLTTGEAAYYATRVMDTAVSGSQ